MAVPVLTQRLSSIGSAAGTAPGNTVDAIKTLVDFDNVALGSLARWYVTGYSAGNYVELGSKAAAYDDDRILFISGAIIAAGARRNTSTTTTAVYICWAKGAGTSGPEQNPAVGNPYPSFPNTLGLSMGTPIGTSVGYFENDAGMGFFFWTTTGSINYGQAGRLIISPNQTLIGMAMACGTTPTAGNVWDNPDAASTFLSNQTTWGASTQASGVAIEENDNIVVAMRNFAASTATTASGLISYDGRSVITHPISITNPSTGRQIGILRQIRCGADASHRSALIEINANIQGYAVNSDVASTGPSIYWTNFI